MVMHPLLLLRHAAHAPFKLAVTVVAQRQARLLEAMLLKLGVWTKGMIPGRNEAVASDRYFSSRHRRDGKVAPHVIPVRGGNEIRDIVNPSTSRYSGVQKV